MGRHKQERIILIGKEHVSRKAMKDSAVVSYGMEPEWHPLNPLLTSEEKQLELDDQIGHAFNWYNAMTDNKNHKAYLVEYSEKLFPEEAKKLKHVPENMFTCGEYHTAGVLARCILRGMPAKEHWIERLSEQIKTLAKSISTVTEEKKTTRDSKVSECIGIVDGMLDDFGFTKKKFPEVCMANAVLKAGASNGQRVKIQAHFDPYIEEIKSAIDGTDEDINEAYKNTSKTLLKKVYEWFIGEPAVELVKAVKITRQRKKKVKTAKQLLKYFGCQKSDSELKINSIEAEHILGAQQLWVFNTKTRKLGVYYANDDTGFTVFRKSVDNYNEKTSYSKKIRKPKEILTKVISAGKVELKHLLEDIRAVKSPIKGRVSDVVLLLRALK